jgi:S1-C subfamily serine protease
LDRGKAEGSKGFPVGTVQKGGPAEKAGLKAGDLIVKFNEFDLFEPNDLIMRLLGHVPGDKIKLLVQREGAPIELETTLGGQPNERAR